MSDLSVAKRRLIDRLKVVESATAPELAVVFGLTETAIRQHLDALEAAGLVEQIPTTPVGRGRPPAAWRLTAAAAEVFPDRHGDLAVELLDAIRSALGPDALDAVLAARSEHVSALAPTLGLGDRVALLATRRSAEGYLAESLRNADGSFTLIEHHCPIAHAARSCGELCDHELAQFRLVLGPDATVMRSHHLMAGDRRCAYVVRHAHRSPDVPN